MWDTIFKAGTHTNSKGQTREFTVGDLHKIAGTTGEIPLVVQHPKNIAESETFGSVSRLRVLGDKLQAQYKDVPASLLALARDGLKLNKSIALDPLSMQLMHVGLLGYGQPPAVAGLGPVCFSFDEGKGNPFLDHNIFSYV